MRIRVFVTFVFVTVSLAGSLGMATPARAQFAVDANTLALWHFDDGSGLTAADATAHGYDLSLARYPVDGSNGSALPSWTDHGCFGGGLHVGKAADDLSGGYASLYQDLAFAQSELTVEVWFVTSSDTGLLVLFGLEEFALEVANDGTLDTVVGDGLSYSAPAVSVGRVDDGLWHYVAVTYDGAHVRLFIDGQQDGVAAYSGTIGSQPGYPIDVGGRPFNTFLTGTIDEVRITDVARTTTAISNSWDQLSVLCPEADRAEESYAALTVLFCLCRRKTPRAT